ncbi:hypothetical protein TNIN_77071 [Trichonephila inaurata madagascariensis]|uniref:Uncharacterized protein n=1 Tax=Trichonephila inaurata madagascariensis TaxID=2747483 RepID=A0A8X6XFN2_9ARAC|nr:hypothetical protein TNIN_77071 [Trichonephila inaurata madagascariensis]
MASVLSERFRVIYERPQRRKRSHLLCFIRLDLSPPSEMRIPALFHCGTLGWALTQQRLSFLFQAATTRNHASLRVCLQETHLTRCVQWRFTMK